MDNRTFWKIYYPYLSEFLIICLVIIISWHHGESKKTSDDLVMNYYSDAFLTFSESLPCEKSYNSDGKLHVVCKNIGSTLELDRLPVETAVLEIHCDHTELNATKFNLYRLEELILDACSNLHLDDDTFRSTTEIAKVLIVSSFDIPDFQQILKAISSLTKLTALSLSRSSGFNRLQRKDMELLNATSLEELDVSGCNIEFVDRDAFEDLPQLKSFDFSSNPLSEIALRNITIALKDIEIRKLVLRHLNKIKELPLGTLKVLKQSLIHHLDLSDNNIPKLQPNSLAYEHLEILKLENNKINYISHSAFRGSLKLEIMDLKGNFLTSIDNQLDHVVNLRVIDLSRQNLDKGNDKKFTITENGLANLTNLEVLSLNEAPFRGNITRFMFNGLVSLDTLQLSRSNIENIADFAFEPMEALKILDLSYNNLRKLGRNVFYKLENLTDLNLKWNKLVLEETDEDPNSTSTFSHLKSLRILNLENNYIEHLSPKVLKNLRELRFLSIKRNKLRSWDNAVFPKESFIRRLWLGHNEIETVSYGMLEDFSSFERLEILDLSENPFNCADCGMDVFQKWVSKRTLLQNYHDIIAYKCASPAKYKDRKISDNELPYSLCYSTTGILTTSSNMNLFKDNPLGEKHSMEIIQWIVPGCILGIGLLVLGITTTYVFQRRKKLRTDNPDKLMSVSTKRPHVCQYI